MKEELIVQIKELLKINKNDVIDINPNYLEYFQEEEASVLLSDRQIFVITEALRMGSNLVSHSHFWDPSATIRLRCC